MPRPKKKPLQDCLLSRGEAADLCDVSPRHFSAYALRWPALVEGTVHQVITPGTKGRIKYLHSAVMTHLREELRGRAVA